MVYTCSMKIATLLTLLVACCVSTCTASSSRAVNWHRLTNRTTELINVVIDNYYKIRAIKYLPPQPLQCDFVPLANWAIRDSRPPLEEVQRKIAAQKLRVTEFREAISSVFEVRTRTMFWYEGVVKGFTAQTKKAMCSIFYEQGTAMCVLEREIYDLLNTAIVSVDSGAAAAEMRGPEMFEPADAKAFLPCYFSSKNYPECGWDSWCMVCGRC